MDTAQEIDKRIDKRLTDLEIKASFGEDLLEELNQVIVRQQQQIDLLIREVRELRQQIPEAGTRQPGVAANDLPPHY
jgi:SlyX protein